MLPNISPTNGSLTIPAGNHIERVTISGLFGEFDYQIPREGYEYSNDDLLILYGTNGCGKTTILKMIFSLLSTNMRMGHKNFLAKTPFKECEISFKSGDKIAAKKKHNKLVG